MSYLIQCPNCHQSFEPLKEDIKLLNDGEITREDVECTECSTFDYADDCYEFSDADSGL